MTTKAKAKVVYYRTPATIYTETTSAKSADKIIARVQNSRAAKDVAIFPGKTRAAKPVNPHRTGPRGRSMGAGVVRSGRRQHIT
jgi:hypothetical protein